MKECVVLVITVGGDGYIRFWSSDDTAELLLEVLVTQPDIGLVDLALCQKSQVLIPSLLSDLF